MGDTDIKLQALFTIFEKHLYDFDDDEESSDKFVDKIVFDYVQHLTGTGVLLPRRWKNQIVDELRDQVRKMLVKKMYGCLSIEEYLQTQLQQNKKRNTSKSKKSA